MILIAVNSTKSEHNTNDNSPNNIFHNKHPNQKYTSKLHYLVIQ